MKALRLGIIGLGQMGEAIAQGLLNSTLKSSFQITGTTLSEASAIEARKKYKIDCGTDNSALVKKSDIIILAVKPHQAEKTLHTISKDLTAEHLIISICASITTEQVFEWSGKKAAIIRAMPNTPCLIQMGMTTLCAGANVSSGQLETAKSIFNSLGKVALIEESLFDGATGLSGCGPAYVFLMIEALSEAGVKVGISRETSTLLAAQTLMGAASLVLQRGKHPASLKDEVTTPAGCTVDGLMALEEGKLRVTLIKAVLAAARRSKSLGKISTK